MATGGESSEHPPEDDMLPDEREVIAERIDQLEDASSHLTVEEVAADLGIELE